MEGQEHGVRANYFPNHVLRLETLERRRGRVRRLSDFLEHLLVVLADRRLAVEPLRCLRHGEEHGRVLGERTHDLLELQVFKSLDEAREHLPGAWRWIVGLAWRRENQQR